MRFCSWLLTSLILCTAALAADTTAPTDVGRLNIQVLSSDVLNLSWSAATDDTAVVGYTVYHDATALKTTTATTVPISQLTADTSYLLTVKAIDAAGNESTGLSAWGRTWPTWATTAPVDAGDGVDIRAAGTYEPRLARIESSGLSLLQTGVFPTTWVNWTARGTVRAVTHTVLVPASTCVSGGASYTFSFPIVSLPPRTVVRSAWMEVKTAAAGATTATLSVGISGAYTDYLVACDIKATAGTIYGVYGDSKRGSYLTGYHVPSTSADTILYARLLTSGAYCSAITDAEVVIYIDTEQLPGP